MARKISMKQAMNEALDQEMARPECHSDGEDVVGGTGCHGEADAWGGVLVLQGSLRQAR
jgi:pyruvate dehydrogenase E1 component beta subunit